MAACDYRLCDLCSRKVYYDASVDYGAYGERLGDWAVICSDCARDHRVVIVKNGEQEKQAAEIAALREAVREAYCIPSDLYVPSLANHVCIQFYDEDGEHIEPACLEPEVDAAVRRALEEER